MKTKAESIALDMWDGAVLTNTTKMPCKSAGFTATACITGAKLRKIKGSVCEKCYAFKGNYNFKPVKFAGEARHYQMVRDYDSWEARMVSAVKKEKNKYFRWHDSGDIQSLEHLQMIFNVCNATGDVKHWIPTREYKFIREAKRLGMVFPKNLIVRVSAPMIDGKPPAGFKNTSTVHKNSGPIGKECRAYTRGGECGKCRACWDVKVKNISYPIH